MNRAIAFAVWPLLVMMAFIPTKKVNDKMKPRFTVLTLGVDNLETSYKFYHEGLGFPSKGIVGTEFPHGAVAFFDLSNGITLALYARDNLAWDAQLKKGPASPTEFSIGYNTGSKAEVDALMQEAATAGARIVKKAQPVFWGGYSGYFQDPDGHLWEIVFNPDAIPKD